MAANYDKIASVYDPLSRLVYGKSIVRAQLFLLGHIPAGSRILIVGGGTGWILEEISRLHPAGLVIDYVENSANMIALSQKRHYGTNRVNFIFLSVEYYSTTDTYHVFFTPFVFDNFTGQKTAPVFEHLNQMLKPGGVWLYADFVCDDNNGRLWQKMLLKMMYLFFKITCNIETDHIVHMERYYRQANYQLISASGFYFGFILAAAYRKP